MKSGVAAAVEALRALRDTDALPGRRHTADRHDLHEAPWGDGRQLNQLITDGVVGDAVLMPEYLNHCVPTIGRGALTWKVHIRRPGPPVHEVMRPKEPSVIAAGAKLILRLNQLNDEIAKTVIRRPGPRASSSARCIAARSTINIHRNFSWRGRAAGCRARRTNRSNSSSWPCSTRWPARPAPRSSPDPVPDPRCLSAQRSQPAAARFPGGPREDLRQTAAAGGQAVLRRCQQLLVAGQDSGDHPWTQRRRGPYAGGMGFDRRPGARRPGLCVDGTGLLRRMTKAKRKDQKSVPSPKFDSQFEHPFLPRRG